MADTNATGKEDGRVIQCVFCGLWAKPSREHVLPRWIERELSVSGPLTLRMGTYPEPTKTVRKLPRLQVTLEDQVCQSCNSGFLSRIENAVAGFLGPMVVKAEPTRLTTEMQRSLAAWAARMACLLEPAFRLHYPDREVEGLLASPVELAWLCKNESPPPRTQVWLSCWDAQSSSPLMYEPSKAPLPTPSGVPLRGELLTFAVGYVSLQVFHVDFVAADSVNAVEFSPPPPSDVIAPAIVKFWPSPTPRTINWPSPAIPHEAWQSLVTWDGSLRPG
jgi:hypothetical protein